VFVALVLTGALVLGKVCSVLRSLACTAADGVVIQLKYFCLGMTPEHPALFFYSSYLLA